MRTGGYKMFYLDAIYTNNKMLYVNIEDLFRTLDIACSVDQVGNRLDGFIENGNKTYIADYTTGQLQVGDKTFNNTNMRLGNTICNIFLICTRIWPRVK